MSLPDSISSWCFRSLQVDVSNGKLAPGQGPTAFRQMCQAAILHWWSTSRQQALYTNSLLNAGNELFSQLESRSQPQTSNQPSAPLHASAFWASAPDISSLLAFNYPQSALPANFQPGVQQSSSRRRSEQHKRQQPDSSQAYQQPQKRSKSGSARHKGQASDRAAAKRQSQATELSNKLQQRLASFLELVVADPEPTFVGQQQPTNVAGMMHVAPAALHDCNAEAYPSRLIFENSCHYLVPASPCKPVVVHGKQSE